MAATAEADDSIVLTRAEAARTFKCSPNHISNMVERGELPAIRLGRRLLIPRKAVDALIEGAC